MAQGRTQRIAAVEAIALDVPLRAPFTIATTRLERVTNVAVRVRLDGGAEGWGEVPTLPPVTAEDQPAALAGVRTAAAVLVGRDAHAWRTVARDLEATLPGLAATRAGIEVALLDALTRHWGVPLFEFFGGATDKLTTDITVPICPPGEARALAATYHAAGFEVIKTKVGLDVPADIERVAAIRDGHPSCALVLDANEGYSATQALEVVRALRAAGLEPALFEQPVSRDDWDGLGRVTLEAGVPVAADESCRTPADALRVAHEGLAHVLNIKLAKCGVVGALEITAIARAAGLGLMIGGMVETRLGMGFAAHLVAGLGGFEWIDLDTPLLLEKDPIVGGYGAEGPSVRLDGEVAGHGASLGQTG
jgi:L-alanine-DL-glutamate epimerase-like enolase superfamily enzyme